jgi:uncharacterized protein YqgV (UPF0045/DUF77 family)
MPDRVLTSFPNRIDKAQTMEDKVSAVEKLLAKDEMLKS